MNQTIELFSQGAFEPVERKIARAVSVVVDLFRAGHPMFLAFSGGKDSSVVAAIVLHAALQYRAAGGRPVVYATTSDTLVESPEVTRHYAHELRRMRAFGQAHGFSVTTGIARPTLSATFQVKVLSGRALPSFPGAHGDCSTDLKIMPQRSLRRRLFRQTSDRGMAEPVTCLGTRYDEGDRRAARMKARGESDRSPVRNRDGDLVLSPIAHFGSDDVWEAIALYGSGQLPGYSDFEETKRLYAHSVGTSCAVVADAILAGASGRRQGKCGARLGCHVCQMAEDKSLANMIAHDERYAYAAGLHRLNRFIRNTRFDWSRRHWIGRTIRAGYVKIQPDTYHPSMLRELFRYMLQLDFDEQARAATAGEAPRFELLSLEMIVAIDAMQSLNGVARPFACWADRRDVFERGIRYDIPEVTPVPATPVPAPRFLFVGNEWDQHSPATAWTGLRDPFLEAMTAEAACAPRLARTPAGRVIWKTPTEQQFSVDVESATLLQDFELDRLLDMHDRGVEPGQVTAGYRWYLQYGVLTLSHAQRAEHDQACRRTAFKDRLGLGIEYDIEDLKRRSMSFALLPADAQAAWEHAAADQEEMLFAE
ncbi:hypothetical protein [Cupriavidus sp. WS]|uniref:hypothetical protein n=1 Tax=Cupriavidus sp. WS TaxID=1312922 RepID=UPI000377A9C9|nr:hypothetical protein [Cupriavidus sp. WS]